MYDLVILILSTFRITNLFMYEDGPFEIFERFRKVLNIYQIELADGSTHLEVIDNNQIGKLFSCFWCLSVWVAIFNFLLPEIVKKYLLLPLAISAGAIIIRQKI